MFDQLGLSAIQWEQPEWLQALWALPLLILIYLLRRPVAKIVLPHLPMFEEVLKKLRRRSRFMRLVFSILLQLLIFGTAILLIAGPVRESRKPGQGPTVMIVDHGLGLRARHRETPSRNEKMARAAEEGGNPQGIRSLADLNLEFAQSVATSILSEGPLSVGFLRDELELGTTSTRSLQDLVAAFEDPGQPRGRRPVVEVAKLRPLIGDKTRLVFVTPFSLSESEQAAFDAAKVTVISPKVESIENGGILEVRRSNANTLEVTVGLSARARELQLVRGGKLMASIAVPARAKDESSGPRAKFEVELPPSVGVAPSLLLLPYDDFPEDDFAPLVLPEKALIRVLVVADGATPFLDAYLASSEIVDHARSHRSDEQSFASEIENHDITILVGQRLELPLPKGNYLLLGSGAPDLPIRRVEMAPKSGKETMRLKDDPLVRTLDASQWQVQKGVRTVGTEALEILVKTSLGPLVSRGKAGAAVFIDIAVTPDPAASTLPLLDGFPSLIESALLELVGREGRERSLAKAPVQQAGTLRVLDPHSLPVVRVIDGANHSGDGAVMPLVEDSRGHGYLMPRRPGRYALKPIEAQAASEIIALAWLDDPGRPREASTAPQSKAALPIFVEQLSKESLRSYLGWILGFLLLLEWLMYSAGRSD